MTTYFVTRHHGAIDWAERNDIHIDRLVPHLDPETIHTDDVVVGTLPVNLAGDVCSRGARYLHLSLLVPSELRGTDLTADQMEECGAVVEEYVVAQKPSVRRTE